MFLRMLLHSWALILHPSVGENRGQMREEKSSSGLSSSSSTSEGCSSSGGSDVLQRDVTTIYRFRYTCSSIIAQSTSTHSSPIERQFYA